MANPTRRVAGLGQFPPCGEPDAVGENVEFAVAVDVHQTAGLHAARLGDHHLGPFAEGLARVLYPKEGLAAPIDIDDVGPAIGVDV